MIRLNRPLKLRDLEIFSIDERSQDFMLCHH
ncbi:hypothetical protein SAMN05880584_108103 [Bacillus altitudinis]|nr:hypothetical protein SAMN05880584_108103 [Bacillus altitudinis]